MMMMMPLARDPPHPMVAMAARTQPPPDDVEVVGDEVLRQVCSSSRLLQACKRPRMRAEAEAGAGAALLALCSSPKPKRLLSPQLDATSSDSHSDDGDASTSEGYPSRRRRRRVDPLLAQGSDRFDESRWNQALQYSHSLVAVMPSSSSPSNKFKTPSMVQEEAQALAQAESGMNMNMNMILSTSTQAAMELPTEESDKHQSPTQRTRKKCLVASCQRNAVSTGKCRTHGGGKTCAFTNCQRLAHSRSTFCWNHCGGRRCEAPGCRRLKNTKHSTRFCSEHLVDEHAPSPSNAQIMAVDPSPQPLSVGPWPSRCSRPQTSGSLAGGAPPRIPMPWEQLPSIDLACQVVTNCSLNQFYQRVGEQQAA